MHGEHYHALPWPPPVRERGAVILGVRDAKRASVAVADLSAAGLRAQSVRLDLTDHAGIAAATESIRAEHGRLDILVNNASIVDARDGPPTTGAPDAARRILETNFGGTLAVTQAMLLLRESRAARIVDLSSSLGSLALNGDPSSPYYAARLIGYYASKAVLNMLTVQLAEELHGTPHVINSVSLRFVRTDLTGHAGFMTPEEGAPAGRVRAARRGRHVGPVRRGERRDTVVKPRRRGTLDRSASRIVHPAT